MDASRTPASLRALQEEFGRALRTPLGFDTGTLEARPEAYPEAAVLAVSPGPGPAGHPRERIAIYNRQYWFRLFTVLQADFPLLAACLGPWEFNRLASAYLSAHPPRRPTLEGLGDRLPAFLTSRPRYGMPWLTQAARLDAACLKAFHAPAAPPLDPARFASAAAAARDASDGEDDAEAGTALGLQPWLTLFEEDWDLVETRERILAEAPAGWLRRPLLRASKGRWAVGRHAEGWPTWTRLEEGAFRILAALERGHPLEEACASAAAAAADLGPEAQEAFAEKVPGWFAEWTALGWWVRPGGSSDGTRQ